MSARITVAPLYILAALATSIATTEALAANLTGDVDLSFGDNGYVFHHLGDDQFVTPMLGVNDSDVATTGITAVLFRRDAQSPANTATFVSNLTGSGDYLDRLPHDFQGLHEIESRSENPVELTGLAVQQDGTRIVAAVDVFDGPCELYEISDRNRTYQYQDPSQARPRQFELNDCLGVAATEDGFGVVSSAELDRSNNDFDARLQITRFTSIHRDTTQTVIDNGDSSWADPEQVVGLSGGRIGLVVTDAPSVFEIEGPLRLFAITPDDSAVDTTFGTQGYIELEPVQVGDVTYNFSFIAIDPADRLYVVRDGGTAATPGQNRNAHITRYNAAGSIMSGFGDNGVLVTQIAAGATLVGLSNGSAILPSITSSNGEFSYRFDLLSSNGRSVIDSIRVSNTNDPGTALYGAQVMSIDSIGRLIVGGTYRTEGDPVQIGDWAFRTTSLIDMEPTAPEFTTPTVNPGEEATSNEITISGLPNNLPVYAVMEDGQISVNGNSFLSGSAVIENGDTVRVRHVASSSPTTQRTTFLKIGGTDFSGAGVSPPLAQSFKAVVQSGSPEHLVFRGNEIPFTSMTTDVDTEIDPISFEAVRNAGVGSEVTSNAQTISGITQTASATVTDGILEVNGQRISSGASPLQNGDSIRLITTAPSTGNTEKTVTLVVSGVSVAWSVTTGEAPVGDGGGSGAMGLGGLILLGWLALRRRQS